MRARLDLSRSCSWFWRVVSRRLAIIWLMLSLSWPTSPGASTAIARERSPLVTAVATSAMARTWSVRLSASELTESVRSRQVPETPLTSAWPPSLPSVPTSRATRVTSSANDESWSTMVLMVSFSSATSPRASTVIFCDRSPPATAVVTWAMLRTCVVRLEASWLTWSVRSFQVLATELALGAHLARHPRHLVGERRQLVDHGVDDLADAQELALHGAARDGQRHLLVEVPLRHRGDDPRHLVGGARQVVDQGVDGIDRGRPGAAHRPWLHPLGHAALLADHPGDPGQLAAQPGVLVDQVVVGADDLAGQARRAAGLEPCALARLGGGQGSQQVVEEPLGGLCAAVGAAGGALHARPRRGRLPGAHRLLHITRVRRARSGALDGLAQSEAATSIGRGACGRAETSSMSPLSVTSQPCLFTRRQSTAWLVTHQGGVSRLGGFGARQVRVRPLRRSGSARQPLARTR